MVKDRLAELQRNCDNQSYVVQRDNIVAVTVDEKSPEFEINQILSEYSEIRNGIAMIKKNVDKMRTILAEITTSFQNSKDLPASMDEIREENLMLCKQMFAKMKDLEIGLPWKDDFSTVARIKRTNFFCIRDDFLTAWREHEHFLVNYEEKIIKTLMKQAKIMDSNMTEEETENLIANKTTSLFVGNFLEETEMARQNLRELLLRHSELTKIERSITEVRDMFLRISTLIMEQSALVQVVEYHAQQATMNTEKGTDDLEKARDLKLRRLKRKTCILIWVAVVLTVIIVLLIIF